MDRGARKGIAVIAVLVIAMLAMWWFAPKQAKKVTHPANDDAWLLVSYDPDTKDGTYLGNGFISTRIMGDGVGSQNGQPLPCFMAGFYDNEKLVPIPTWSDLRFYDGKTQFKIDKNADYKQVLDMKTGILTTYATWRAGSKALKGKIEVLVSRTTPSVGMVRAILEADYQGSLVCTLRISDPRKAKSFSAAMNVHATRSGVCITSDIDCGRKIGAVGLASQAIRVRAGKPFTVTTIASLRRSSAAANLTADQLAGLCRNTDALVAAHKAAWAKLWQHDIVIDGPKKDQQALHSCRFYLLQSVREGSQWSIPPMGLSSDAFSGHVFWDADVWMFPALILQHPELARSIVDYRYNTLSGAMANAKASGYAGAEYAWESAMTGKEDTPEGLVYRHERHVDGDIALAQWQYYLATNDLGWLKARGYPVIKATADYWVSRAVLANGRYEIKRVVPPDENAEMVDNSVYTNAIAKMNLEIASRAAKIAGLPANPKWSVIAAAMYIPFDSKAKRFVAFDGYKGMKAKQADTELLAYPLQFSYPGQDMAWIYRNTLDFYAPKVLPKGPAMSSSAHSVIRARLGDCDRAYRDFAKSYKPYIRGPFNYFNEKPSRFLINTCFLTGCAGPVQAAIYGLGGVHMDYFPADPATAPLSYTPCLPKQWKSIKITGMQWHGKTFDLMVERGNKVQVVQKQ